MKDLLETLKDKTSDAKSRVEEFIKKLTAKEKTPSDHVVGGIGALAPGYIVGQKLLPAYSERVIPELFTDIVPYPTPAMADKMKDSKKFINFLKSEGYTLKSDAFMRNNAFFAPAIKPTDNIKGSIGWGDGQLPAAPVLAHEYGHAKNNELYRKLLGGRIGANTLMLGGIMAPAKLGAPVLGAVSTGATLLGYDDTALTTGLAGLGAGTPLVLEETLASARGAHALKKLGMGGRLKAFAGVPSYMMNASLPVLPIAGKKFVEKLVESAE